MPARNREEAGIEIAGTPGPTPAHVRVEELEGWMLGKLDRLVLGNVGGTSYALDRIVATLMGEDGSTGEVERIEGELGKSARRSRR